MLAALLLATTLTINDYATMPQIAAPRWAPDGRRIAYVLTKADLERSAYDADVWLVDADGTNARQLTQGTGSDTKPRWSSDGKRIAFLSDRSGANQMYVIDVDGGEARPLTNESTAVRELEWSPDGTTIAFTRIDRTTPEEKDGPHVVGEGTKHVHLYLADVESGRVRRLTRGEFSVFSFSWSPDGNTIAFDRGPGTGLDALYETDIYTIARDGGEPKPLVVQPGLDQGPLYSPDGKWIAFTSLGGTSSWLIEHDIYVVPATGGVPRDISSAYGRTPDRIVWSDDSSAVVAEAPWGTTTRILRFGSQPAAGSSQGPTNRSRIADRGSRENDWALLRTANCDLQTRCSGTAGDVDLHGDRIAYIYESLTAPPELYVDQRQLTHHNDAYRDRALGETRVIRWKNPKDGLEIEGLLTLPVGYVRGTRVPLLTFAHGGPASHFDESFLGYLGPVYAPQVLAANGFAVLCPNPRGSGGYGAKFRQANVGDWGGMDWIDVNAGIDKVIADGIADPKRLGFMGWSYGGFLAAWAIGHSDRFLAISVGAPVVDLLSHHATSDLRDFIPAYFPGLSRDALRAHSPAWQLKKTNAKVLILQGENDERVPPTQGLLLYRLLRDLGVDATMVTYPRTLHTARELNLRLDVMRRNLELFTKTIPR